jgi:acetoacetyl-CoA reductase/3-oxoacyl-[acyl-carrier protein] reductase
MSAAPQSLARLLSLEGRQALVTGGSGAIGSAIVHQLQAAGAQVLSVDQAGRPVPAGAEGLECDLGDREALRDLLLEVRGRAPRLSILVHCAGITRDGVLWKLSDEQWSSVLAVNLDAAFHLLHGTVPLMREAGGGAVVLITSINGERGKFGQANYAASKAGLIGLGKTAARELGRFGIRVNCVAPGLIESEMTADLPTEVRQAAVDETALGRTGRPDDVAGTVLFLCADASRHVTGQTLRVDGGQLIA